jgi:hypothetical protein
MTIERIAEDRELFPRATWKPRTPLGRRLGNRERIVASGELLLGWEEIGREIVERRGEFE